MSARRPAEAVQSYVDSLQLAVACVSDSILTVRDGYHPSSSPHLLTLNNGNPSALRGDLTIDLRLSENYVIERVNLGPTIWGVRTTSYLYTLQLRGRSTVPLREIVSYHWHPHARSNVTLPHLHLGSGAGALFSPLTKAHLPTAHISHVAFLRLTIEAFEATPRRPDWEAILALDIQ